MGGCQRQRKRGEPQREGERDKRKKGEIWDPRREEGTSGETRYKRAKWEENKLRRVYLESVCARVDVPPPGTKKQTCHTLPLTGQIIC